MIIFASFGMCQNGMVLMIMINNKHANHQQSGEDTEK